MRACLIDGNNLLARANHAALASKSRMSFNGVETGTVHLFVGLISKYVRLVKPTHLAVMWDAGHDYRDEIYPAYKANRSAHIEGSEDTIPFALTKEFLTWAGVPHKSHRGFEADDLIAATARQCRDGQVAIVSGDKDLLQLIVGEWGGSSVIQYRVPDDEPWTFERYVEIYGYAPESAAAVHALVGDTSDNVPGLKGIGPKKAVKMLEEANWDWETLLANLGPERAVTASLMRRLVDLRDCEYPSWFMDANRGCPEWAPTPFDGDSIASVELRNFCERHALKSIAERLTDGTLWVEPEALKPTEEAVFDGIGDLTGSNI